VEWFGKEAWYPFQLHLPITVYGPPRIRDLAGLDQLGDAVGDAFVAPALSRALNFREALFSVVSK
jgi:hypothetical protein